ncbi:MAG: methyltransferase domain-containing protein [candidate division Zixibacteria bacterium]|nr:methyltransferase domain-containing protein [candidate division Zixibacteria bacterium]
MYQVFHNAFVTPETLQPLTYEGDLQDGRWTNGKLIDKSGQGSFAVVDSIPVIAGVEKDPWGDGSKVNEYFSKLGRTPAEVIRTNYTNIMTQIKQKAEFVSEVATIAKEGGLIVEINCGQSGGFAPLVLEANPEATVLMADLGRWLLNEWKAYAPELNWPNVSFAQLDPLHLPFADNSISAVTSYGGYSGANTHSPALKEVHRVLKPAGRLFMLDARPDPAAFRKLPAAIKNSLREKHPSMGVGYGKLMNSVGFTAASYVETGRRPIDLRSYLGAVAAQHKVGLDVLFCKVMAQKDRA